jgi:hypothetical protein
MDLHLGWAIAPSSSSPACDLSGSPLSLSPPNLPDAGSSPMGFSPADLPAGRLDLDGLREQVDGAAADEDVSALRGQCERAQVEIARLRRQRAVLAVDET